MTSRKLLMFVGLVLKVIVYQTLLADLLTVGSARPDLILILIVWLTLTRDLTWGVSFAFLAGIIEDSHTPQFLGLGAFLKIAGAVAVYLISRRVRTDRLIIKIGMVAAVVLAHDILYFLVVYSFDVQLGFATLFHTIIPSAAYTSVIAAVVLYLAERQLTIKFES
ncbi:MAG: rod shape-determining protein MreD [candidate division Zixibacteria bacterium]|nr:rod shape-determining protein MreD [candidate division Zixibacteria bacterium]